MCLCNAKFLTSLLINTKDNLISTAIHNNFPYVVDSLDNKYNILVSGFGSVKTIGIPLGFLRLCSLKPVLNWANVCSPNILRTLRQTMICFLIELLVRQIWFGQS